MNTEFSKIEPNTAASANGFTVEAKFAGGVHYHDDKIDLHIDSEWLMNPFGILLYKSQFSVNKLSNLPQTRIDEIFSNVIRGLEFLGHRVEIS
jgi:hypothetical protein